MEILKKLFGGWSLGEWLNTHVTVAICGALFTLLCKWLAPDVAQLIVDHVKAVITILIGVASTFDWLKFRTWKKAGN